MNAAPGVRVERLVGRFLPMNSENQTKEWLSSHGFDGLYVAGTCCCELSDLGPCGQLYESCKPGYKHLDPRPGHEGWWAVFGKKETPTNDEWGDFGFY